MSSESQPVKGTMKNKMKSEQIKDEMKMTTLNVPFTQEELLNWVALEILEAQLKYWIWSIFKRERKIKVIMDVLKKYDLNQQVLI